MGLVKVTILPDRETRMVRARTVAAMLTELQLHQDAFLVVRGDEILTRDVRLKDDDEVELLPVISGGAPA
jgi:sulfur carrier protein